MSFVRWLPCLALPMVMACGPMEFQATPADFANFNSWMQTTSAPLMGPGPMSGAVNGAHDSSDATVSRRIYINSIGQAARAATTAFPIGTILVKQQKAANGTVRMTLAMAKRGGNFNPAAGNWEWFILNPDGTIMTRGGADVLGGACNNCHVSAAASKDLVFTR